MEEGEVFFKVTERVRGGTEPLEKRRRFFCNLQVTLEKVKSLGKR
jgi:hypothetical protein